MYGNSLKFFSERAESASLEELVEQSSATAPDWNAEGEYVAAGNRWGDVLIDDG